MNVPGTYEGNLSLEQKVMYVLSLLQRATADEVAMEIMELEGTATEEGVAELTIATNEALRQLQHDGMLKMETSSDKQTRYWLAHAT
ncbi:hypothetical protein [Aridibaculum aurantiacum]|uniref:hypothetical protein n=1 Tax=Aridibaculum aurantiacum TaxID=2810307 RepID=UPI001A9638AF|nr:hypothetical protein [Aridibaculum aurantiacum]